MQLIPLPTEKQTPAMVELEAAYAHLYKVHFDTGCTIEYSNKNSGFLEPTRWSARIEKALNDPVALDEIRSQHKRTRIIQEAAGFALWSAGEQLAAAVERMKKALQAAIGQVSRSRNDEIQVNNCLVAAELHEKAQVISCGMGKVLHDFGFDRRQFGATMIVVFQESFQELLEVGRSCSDKINKLQFLSVLGKNSLRITPRSGSEYCPGFIEIETRTVSPACLALRERIEQLEKVKAIAERAHRAYLDHGKGVVNEKQHAARVVEILYRTESGKPATFEAQQLAEQDKRRCAYYSNHLALAQATSVIREFTEGTVPFLVEALEDTRHYESGSNDCLMPIWDCLVADYKMRECYSFWNRMHEEMRNDVSGGRAQQAFVQQWPKLCQDFKV
ncbi:MAG: hypothetical protein K2W82_14125 [Candidatus Obscuribacterales bacterium]|nr:hypothetical protein [Candidatus Obscuribacterales bacterium]